MSWMNRYDIEDAARDYAGDDVLGPATCTLYNLMRWTDDNSDGWPYWVKPSRASVRLQDLIQNRQRAERSYDRYAGPVTAADVRKAYTPIKAFLTRRGVEHDEIVVPV